MSSTAETEALKLVSVLLADLGTPLAEIVRPEEDTSIDINNDFLVSIDSEIWGLEVMRLTLNDEWVAAGKLMLAKLEVQAEEIAKRRGVNITLLAAPPLGLRTKHLQTQWLSDVCAEIEESITEEISSRLVMNIDIHVEISSEDPIIKIFHASTSTPNTQRELNEACAETLTYKLTEQLPSISAHYSKRGIILDSRQDDSKMPSFFPLSSHTVLGLLNAVQADPDVSPVDGAWWISPDGVIQEIV